MTSQDSNEQITLSSTEFDQFKDDDKPNTITSELSQAIKIKEQLKLFRIFDKKYINVNEKTGSGVTSYFFKMAYLDPEPLRKRKLKFKHLLLGVALLGIAWLTFSLKKAGHPLFSSLYVYTAIATFVAIGLILIVYVIKEFRNVLVFYSQHGRIPVVELFYRIPDKVEFNKFVSEIIECIKTTKSQIPYSGSQLLAAELTEHRKLRDDGAISSNDYENAKNNIMKHH